MQFILASRNPKKCAELLGLLAPLGIDVRPVSALPAVTDIEETGLTFEVNAALKAEHVCAATGLPAIADDSGLEVDALAGAPGVRSARFAGEDATDQQNNALLLERMRDLPHAQRRARFVCVVALARPDEPTVLFRGETGGRILEQITGDLGFGYDPLFLSDDLGLPFGQVPASQKHTVSHRGRALRQLLAYCKEALGTGR